MDTVILDGVMYKKASVVAKDFKYTSDYIGQLCRGKKVDARLVGRTWFVNPDSITAHKKTKHSKKTKKSEAKTVVASSDESSLTNKTKLSRTVVEPVITNKTAKFIERLGTKLRDTESKSDTRKLKVSYERDEEHLIPNIERRVLPPAKSLRVEPAGAQKVKVSGKRSAVTFKASELPEISLSGKIRIQSIPQDLPEDDIEETSKNKAITPEVTVVPTKSKLKVRVNKRVKKRPVKSIADNSSDESKTSNSRTTKPVMHKEAPSKPVRSTRKKTEVKFSPASVEEKVKPVKISFAVLASPAIATVLALVCVTAIFSANTSVEVSESSYKTGVEFQTANLIEIFKTK